MWGDCGTSYLTATFAQRHGFAGARSVGGLGGHFWAPQLINS